MLPFRGTLPGWRNGLTKALLKFEKGKWKSSIWGRTTPCISKAHETLKLALLADDLQRSLSALFFLLYRQPGNSCSYRSLKIGILILLLGYQRRYFGLQLHMSSCCDLEHFVVIFLRMLVYCIFNEGAEALPLHLQSDISLWLHCVSQPHTQCRKIWN